jgi:hypothetical protein
MSTSIEPFRIAATDDQLDELKRRLRATRWPERECVDDWSQGLPLSYAQEVCAYWLRNTTGATGRHGSTGSLSLKPPLTDSASISYTCAHLILMPCRW